MNFASGGKPRAAAGNTFDEVLARRIARRSFLKGAVAAAPLLVVGPSLLARGRSEAAETDKLSFQPIVLNNQDRVLIAQGYDSQVLIRWGDPRGRVVHREARSAGSNRTRLARRPMEHHGHGLQGQDFLESRQRRCACSVPTLSIDP